MKISLHITIILLLLFSILGCSNNETSSYPPHLTKAIDLFYKENEYKQVLSELDSLNTAAQSKEINRLACIFKAAALCEMGNADSATLVFQKIKDDRSNSNFSFFFNSIQGLILFRKEKLSDAYETLSNTLLMKNVDHRALGLNKRILGRIALTLGDYDKGLECLLLSTQHFQKSGLRKSVAINYKLIGRYYASVRNYKDAFRYFKTSERLLADSNDKSELFYVYINLIDYYLYTKDLSTARQYAYKCHTQCKDVLDHLMLTLLYNNMGEIELADKNYTTAIQFFNKTLQTPPDYATVGFRRANAHVKLAKIYRLTNRKTEALLHAQLARTYLPHSDYHNIKYETYSELAQNYYLCGKSQIANIMVDNARKQMDSVYSILTKSTKDYYKTKSKLLTLSYNMERIKEKERKHRNVYLAIIVGLTALFIFAFVIYHLQRSKTNMLKVLVIKNLEIIEDERKLFALSQQKNETRKTIRNEGDQEKSVVLYTTLRNWLEAEKHFTRKDLNLELVAKELNTNREYLSRAISEQNIRFNDLINKYRVQEVIRILSDKNNKICKYSLSAIASEVGFNSNSVFIDAFRKQTGMNPAQFRNNLNSTESAE